MNIIKTEEEVLQAIIDKDGNCIDAGWCLICPFADKCVSKAITKARKLLPRKTRVRLAQDKLFNELVEKELEQ